MKHHRTQVILVASFLLFLTGCRGLYVPPANDQPRATLHMVTDHPHLTISGWRYYANSHCSDSSSVRLAAFSRLYDGEKKVQLAANKKGYLIVSTTSPGPYTCNASGCGDMAACRVEFEFSPVAGKTYLAKHSGNGANCSVQITDEATGQAAAEVAQIPFDQNCK